jgi:hypothetical protein
MQKGIRVRLLAIVLACAAVSTPYPGEAGQGRGRGRGLEGNPRIVKSQQDRDTRGRSNSSRIYQDPASSKGYDTGYDLGLADGSDGERYDPVRHKDYRDGDRGYASSYGTRDGYKTNFRSGFRQGYEDGYRQGMRSKK